MIVVDQLTKSYRDVKAVDGVSFEAPRPGSLAILGPSGSGKTTLLRLIAGLEIPDAGEIHINGELVSQPGWAAAPYKRGLGLVFQTSALWPHMTVAQNILFGLHGRPKEEARGRLSELLEQTSLGGLERRYPHEISGGEARRVALARTLAPRPRCLLLDEPLTNVDPDLKRKLLSLIQEEVRQTEACLIYVTHDSSEAGQISGRVLLLKDGCLEIDYQTTEGMDDEA